MNRAVGIMGALALAMLCAMSLVLAKSNLKLRGVALSSASMSPNADPGQEVALGTRVPVLHGATVAGGVIRMPPSVPPMTGARPMLIFVFASECAFCNDAWRAWDALMTPADRRAFAIVGISLNRSLVDKVFLASHHLAGIPVFLSLDRRDIVSYRLRWAPQTIFVDSYMRVEWVHTGPLDADDVEQFQKVAGLVQ